MAQMVVRLTHCAAHLILTLSSSKAVICISIGVDPGFPVRVEALTSYKFD